MYKLLIVDDEQSIRRGMANSVPWNQWGFEVVGLAEDGTQAVDQIKSGNKPDIVLSDIRMPKMDGVELMQYLNKNYPEIKIVILSGYSDFEYLNMSIKNNVAEYLLKPTDMDEFEALFRRMKDQLDEENKKEQQARMDRQYRQENMLNLLVKGYIEELPDDDEMAVELDVDLAHCMLALFYLDENPTTEKRELHDLRKKIITLCNESGILSSDGFSSRFFLAEHDRMAAVISGAVEDRARLMEYLQKFRRLIAWEFFMDVSVGVGSLCEDVRTLSQSYEQAVCCAHQKVLLKEEGVSFYEQMKNSQISYQPVSFDGEKIANFISKKDMDGVKQELDRVFSVFESHVIPEYGYMEQVCLELLFYLSRWAMQYNIQMEELMREHGWSYSDIRETVNMEQRKELLYRIAQMLAGSLEGAFKKNRRYSSVAQAAKNYIDEQYLSNAVSLEALASELGKTSSYVSRAFKEEYGCRFSEYLTEKRMEGSKALLADFSLKIYEIAEKIGYVDVSNFIRLFKKKYGISPGEYRETLGGEVEDAK